MSELSLAVDTYIDAQAPLTRYVLTQLRVVILDCVPEVKESMHFNFPTYSLEHPVCAYAAGQPVLSLYFLNRRVFDMYRDEFSHLHPEQSRVRFHSLDQLPMDVLRLLLKQSAQQVYRSY